MIGNDIISVLFLALFAIVIAGVLYRVMPDTSLMMPSFVLCAVGLWIAYDYILLKKYKERHVFNKPNTADLNDMQEQELNSLIEEIQQDTKAHQHQPSLKDFKSNEEDPYLITNEQNEYVKNPEDIFGNDLAYRDLYNAGGCCGDNRIANRMKYLSIQPQLAKETRAGYGKYSIQGFFEEELREGEARDWWDDNPSLDAWW